MVEYSYLSDDGITVVPVRDISDLPDGKGWYDPNKIVKQEDYKGYFISTVHLPVNHKMEPWDDEDKWFETMIFKNYPQDEWCERTSTYEKALEQHERAKEFIDGTFMDSTD